MSEGRRFFILHPVVPIDNILSLKVKMAEEIQTKLEKYRTAPFDARFPNQNQTRNCWSNYLGKTARQGQSSQLCFHTFLIFLN